MTVAFVADYLSQIDSHYGSYGIYQANDPADIFDGIAFANALVKLSPEEAASLCNAVIWLVHGDALLQYSLAEIYSTPCDIAVDQSWVDRCDALLNDKVNW